METTMRHVPTALMMLLMFVFLGLGFYGLAQHVSKQVFGHRSSIEQVGR
jgi:hypothetical protein